MPNPNNKDPLVPQQDNSAFDSIPEYPWRDKLSYRGNKSQPPAQRVHMTYCPLWRYKCICDNVHPEPASLGFSAQTERAAQTLVDRSVCAEPSGYCEESVAIHYNDLISLITTALSNAVAAERERAAGIAEDFGGKWEKLGDYGIKQGYVRKVEAANEIAAAIRGRVLPRASFE